MLIPDLTERLEASELMDAGGLDDVELSETLRFLGVCNRWLGGWSVLRETLRRWSRDWAPGCRVRLLDIGTGGGDLSRLAAAWGREQGFDLRLTAIDADPAVVAWARRACAGAGVEVAQADLEEFAASGRRFDYVFASLVLHHIPPGAIPGALRACDALAERGVLISDLRRCAPGYLGVRALTALFGDRITRHDGPVSVRRAFREDELRAEAERAGMRYLRACRHPFFRLSLSGEKA